MLRVRQANPHKYKVRLRLRRGLRLRLRRGLRLRFRHRRRHEHRIHSRTGTSARSGATLAKHSQEMNNLLPACALVID